MKETTKAQQRSPSHGSTSIKRAPQHYDTIILLLHSSTVCSFAQCHIDSTYSAISYAQGHAVPTSGGASSSCCCCCCCSRPSLPLRLSSRSGVRCASVKDETRVALKRGKGPRRPTLTTTAAKVHPRKTFIDSLFAPLVVVLSINTGEVVALSPRANNHALLVQNAEECPATLQRHAMILRPIILSQRHRAPQ